MLDIGWMELLLIGIVALVVVGPKELPGMFRTAGRYMGKARGMAREFQRSMEQAADDAGLSESAKHLRSINKLNLNSATGSARRYAESMVKDTKAAVEAPLPDAGAKSDAEREPAADPKPPDAAPPGTAGEGESKQASSS